MDTIILKELELGAEVKCDCGTCGGTGLYQGCAERDGLAVLCTYCGGKGFVR